MTATLVEKYLISGKTVICNYGIWHGLDVPEGQLNIHIKILNIFMLVATAKLLLGICHRRLSLHC